MHEVPTNSLYGLSILHVISVFQLFASCYLLWAQFSLVFQGSCGQSLEVILSLASFRLSGLNSVKLSVSAVLTAPDSSGLWIVIIIWVQRFSNLCYLLEHLSCTEVCRFSFLNWGFACYLVVIDF